MPDKKKAPAKAPRWENEEWILEHPDPKKSTCKDCMWRSPDRTYKGEVFAYGATLGMCQVLPFKPDGIAWGREKCPYYLKGEPEVKSEEIGKGK